MAEWGNPHEIPCTMTYGCMLPGWHPGMCCTANPLEDAGKRQRKASKPYEIPKDPPREKVCKLVHEPKAAPDGAAPSSLVADGINDPSMMSTTAKLQRPEKKVPQKKRRKRKKAEDEVEAEAAKAKQRKVATAPAPAVPAKRTGARGGTRSHGKPLWAMEQEPKAEPPVLAAVSVDGGRVCLELAVRAAAPPAKLNKGLLALRDYLAKGHADPFANDSCTSVSCEQIQNNRNGKVINWGCLCRGNSTKGGLELTCKRCELTFHAKCERLDYTQVELEKMQTQGSFICADCEQLERAEQGYDPNLGRFMWTCRTCTRSFDEELFHQAEKHGARCAAQIARRQWKCACDGKMAGSGTKLLATQCKGCEFWFHFACKSQLRNSWESGGKKLSRELCAECEKKPKPGKRACAQPSGGGASENSDGNGNGIVAPPAPVPPVPAAVSRAKKVAALGDEQFSAALSAAARVGEQPGTLADGRVYVKESALPNSGLGLFAGVLLRRNEVVTGYYGTPLYKGQVAPDLDTSYILRLPNSGGILLNGKPYADAVRANSDNPQPDGRYVPLSGAIEWQLGAGSFANDPRDRRRNNAILCFKKPKVAAGTNNKYVRDLAPVLPVLLATRDIQPDEEIFYSCPRPAPA